MRRRSAARRRPRTPNIARSVDGTSRTVVPDSRSTPNSTPMNSSGAAIHAVTPSDSGPPMAKPMKPAACWRPAGVCGEPAHRCHRPSAGSAIIAEPSTSRGRASGSGSVLINATATSTATIGSSTTAEPISVRNRVSTHCPTGRAALNQLLASDQHGDAEQRQRNPVAAMARLDITGAAHRARGAVRRLWPPSATRHCTPRPTASAPAVSGARILDLRRLAGFLRGAGREPLRELAFDLVVRFPERAAVLLGMVVKPSRMRLIRTIRHTGHRRMRRIPGGR